MQVVAPMPELTSYMICTSPRSGSTLLCRLLREAGTAGVPDSHFHAPSLDAWLGYYALKREAFDTQADAVQAVFAAAYAHGKGTSEVFGLRMQRHSFVYFAEQLGVLHPLLAGDRERIEAAFGRTLFVHLTREDKLDQAISFVKAEQTGLWHMASDGTELERASAPKDPIYDAAAIAAQLAASKRMDQEWEAWFAAQAITPLRVTYSALSAAPYGTLGRVLTALGQEWHPREETAPPIAKLADAVNANWAARFRAEQGL